MVDCRWRYTRQNAGSRSSRPWVDSTKASPCGVVNANAQRGDGSGEKRRGEETAPRNVRGGGRVDPWSTAVGDIPDGMPAAGAVDHGSTLPKPRVRRGQRQNAQRGDGSGKKRRRDKTAPGNVRGVGRVDPWSTAVGDIPDRMPAAGAVDHGSTLPRPARAAWSTPTRAARRRNNGATGAPGRPAFPRTSVPGHRDGRPASPASAGAGSPGLRPQAPRRAPTPAGRRPWRCRADLRRRVR